jgi:hypothetical protein
MSGMNQKMNSYEIDNKLKILRARETSLLLFGKYWWYPFCFWPQEFRYSTDSKAEQQKEFAS